MFYKMQERKNNEGKTKRVMNYHHFVLLYLVESIISRNFASENNH